MPARFGAAFTPYLDNIYTSSYITNNGYAGAFTAYIYYESKIWISRYKGATYVFPSTSETLIVKHIREKILL